MQLGIADEAMLPVTGPQIRQAMAFGSEALRDFSLLPPQSSHSPDEYLPTDVDHLTSSLFFFYRMSLLVRYGQQQTFSTTKNGDQRINEGRRY